MADNRWAPAVSASTVFTDDQARRVQALRVAREVVEIRQPGGAFATGGTGIDHEWLLKIADWIMDGTIALETAELLTLPSPPDDRDWPDTP